MSLNDDHAPRDEPPPDPAGQYAPERIKPPTRVGWLQRRREKVIEEIDRNRRGDYKIPTWVLGVALLVIIATWAILIIVS